jgi:hypothetical protein
VTNTHLALKPAFEAGAGVGVLPDYATQGSGLVPVLREVEMPSLESYLVYPAEMRSVARVQAFRDFLVAQAKAGHIEKQPSIRRRRGRSGMSDPAPFLPGLQPLRTEAIRWLHMMSSSLCRSRTNARADHSLISSPR